MSAFKKIINHRGGFTLIELLVVIVIISILATLLMVNIVGVRQRGRDAQRKADTRQLQTALELYRADNGSYPNSLPPSGDSVHGSLGACLAPLTADSVTYITKIPCDPLGVGVYNSGKYGYTVLPPEDLANGVPINYHLNACLENANDPDPNVLKSTAGTYGCASGVLFHLRAP